MGLLLKGRVKSGPAIIMKTKPKPITVTLQSSNLLNAIIEFSDYLIENPTMQIASIHFVSFHMPGKTKWKVRFTEKD